MWTPTHVVVTVLRGRNLLDKGKGGNDAYCMIGLGKEKFLTSVRAKTLSPVWDEQAEFELSERADLKLTVYHKSSIIDEFLGRVVINISDFLNESNQSITRWFKLQAKPEKSESSSKKPEKERGEIEVRIEFVIRPKTGSVMDLSVKSRENSLSLRNLKDKSLNIKHSLGDKLKILNKPRKPKFAGENQLAEQAKRMNNGSKLDFLEGDDLGSLTSSYSSINGSTFSRFDDAKPANAMSRFNPGRSSFMSRNSSISNSNRMDSDSINGVEDLEQPDDELQQSFNRNNSFRKSSLRRHSKRSSQFQPPDADNANGNLHIAPLPPFLNGNPFFDDETKPADLNPQQQRSYEVLSSIIMEESPPTKSSAKKEAPKIDPPPPSQASPGESFASIFAASLGNESSDQTAPNPHFSTPNKTNNSITNPFLADDFINDSNNNNVKSKVAPVVKVVNGSKIDDDPLKIETLIISTKDEDEENNPGRLKPMSNSNSPAAAKSSLSSIHSSMTTMVKSEPAGAVTGKTKSSSYFNSSNSNQPNDEDEDHIDWASSEDDEIVKQEVETFERNQVVNSPQQTDKPLIKPETSLLAEQNNSDTTGLVNEISERRVSVDSSKDFNKQLFEIDSFWSQPPLEKPNKQALSKNFPLTSSFQIDLDPFSSSSSASSSQISPNKPEQTFDPFLDTVINTMSVPATEELNGFETDFAAKNPDMERDDEPAEEMNEINDISWNREGANGPGGTVMETLVEEDQTVDKTDEAVPPNVQNDDSSSDEEYQVPAPISKNKRPSQVSTSLEIKDPFRQTSFNPDEAANEEDEENMDDAFRSFADVVTTVTANDMDGVEETLGEMSRVLAENDDANIGDMDLAIRKGDHALATVAAITRFGTTIGAVDDDEDEDDQELESKIASESLRGNASTLSAVVDSEASMSSPSPFKSNSILRQSERKRLIPTEDLTSDLNSETDFHSSMSNINKSGKNFSRSSMRIELADNRDKSSKINGYNLDDEIKTPDFDSPYNFQGDESKLNSSNSKLEDTKGTNSGLPDLINQKDSSDKARKYLEGLDGVKFNEIQVPDSLKKQLEYFDRDELLQLIAYQKKYLDFKESRIKDLESYIDNLIVKIIETEPLILMNASSVLNKPRNII